MNSMDIKMLVDCVYELQDSDIELWITGGGNTEAILKSAQRRIIESSFMASCQVDKMYYKNRQRPLY